MASADIIMKKFTVQYMLMMELLCAAALFGILAASFFTVINYMNKAETAFIIKNRSILILDNSLERIDALNSLSPDLIKEIFMDEYQKSDLYENKSVKPVCEVRKKLIILSFKNKNNITLAKVSLKK